MFGNLAQMAGLMKKAKEIQSNMPKIKAEIANAEYTASAGGGRVQVTVSGDLPVKKLVIAPELAGNVIMLHDMVLTAVNAALDNAKAGAQAKMNELTGGLDIPGLF